MPDQMKYQPDFVITVGSKDVTRCCERWELQDLEDAVSTLTVTVVNEDRKYDGAFKIDDKVVIRFGNRGDMSPKVTMNLKELSPIYSDKGQRVVLVGMDPSEAMAGTGGRGMFDETSLKKVLEGIGQSLGLKVEGLDQTEDPANPHNNKIPMPGETTAAFFRRALQMLGAKKGKGGGKVPTGGSPKKPIKSQRKTVAPKGFYGTWGNGNFRTRGGGVAYGDVEKELSTIIKNGLAQVNQSAASQSIRGLVELIGVPHVRAKKCITILNVGPDFSGKWYVRGAAHSWSRGHGYHTRGDLLRDSLGKDGLEKDEDMDRPNVMHCDIYKDNTLYIGPRIMDGDSQATFTFGTAEKLIRTFKATIEVQGSKSAGEEVHGKYVLMDDPEFAKVFADAAPY